MGFFNGGASGGNFSIVPSTTGGLAPYSNMDVTSGSGNEVKGSAGQVYGWHLLNHASGEMFLHFYDSPGTGVTVGTTTPYFTLPLLNSMGSNLYFGAGIEFPNGISIAATNSASGVGVVSTNDCMISMWYE